MASAVESLCHKDPNFAVICNFWDRYGEMIGLKETSYADLERWLEDTKQVSMPLIDIHVRLLRRIGKTSVTANRWERYIIKFCHTYSDVDAWEIEKFGYKHSKLTTKITLLKNLLEKQFDQNSTFKEKINKIAPEDMRFQPIGRDRNGLAYWYMLDNDCNLRVYREDLDDNDAETWEIVCKTRSDLAQLIEKLEQQIAGTTDIKSEEASASNSVKSESVDQELAVSDDSQDSHPDVKKDPEKAPNKLDEVDGMVEKNKPDDEKADIKKDLEDKKDLNKEVIGEKTEVKSELVDEKTNVKTELIDEKINVTTELGDEKTHVKSEIVDEKINVKSELGDEKTNVKSEVVDEKIDIKSELKDDKADVKEGLDDDHIDVKIGTKEIKGNIESCDQKSENDKVKVEEKSDDTNTGTYNLKTQAEQADDKIDENKDSQKVSNTAEGDQKLDEGAKTDNVENDKQKNDNYSKDKNSDKVEDSNKEIPESETSQKCDETPSTYIPKDSIELSVKDSCLSDKDKNLQEDINSKEMDETGDRENSSNKSENISSKCGSSDSNNKSNLESESKVDTNNKCKNENDSATSKLLGASCDTDNADSTVKCGCDTTETNGDNQGTPSKNSNNEIDSNIVNSADTSNMTSSRSQSQEKQVKSDKTDPEHSSKTELNSQSLANDDLEKENNKTPTKSKLKVKGKKRPLLFEDNSTEDSPAVEPESKKSKPTKKILTKKPPAKSKDTSDDTDDSEDIPLSQIKSPPKSSGKKTPKRTPKTTPKAKKGKKVDATPTRKSSRPARKKKFDSDEEEETLPKSKKAKGQLVKKSKVKAADSSDEDNTPLKSLKKFEPETESEDDNGRRRSSRVKKLLKAKKKEPSPAPSSFDEAENDDDSEFTVGSDLDDSDDEFNPTPKGRNAMRQAAIQEEAEEEIPNDTPCLHCNKTDRPEWLLLCDKCDDGYHTACLRPPLMIIPDGDWYCPPCEHKGLLEQLQTNLKYLDTIMKKKDRMIKRKERLAFVGISLDNILKDEHKENMNPAVVYEDYSEEEEYYRKPKVKKQNFNSGGKRSCRSRNVISYKFDDFDDMINTAIKEDMENPTPYNPGKGRSRGKDMANIYMAEGREYVSEEEGMPSPVGGKKKKKGRRLTNLSDDDDLDEDSEEEYRCTDDSSVSEPPEEEEEDDDDVSDYSLDGEGWGRKGTRRSARRGKAKRYKDFIADEDEDSDFAPRRRSARSTRAATRQRRKYKDALSDEEEEDLEEESEQSIDTDDLCSDESGPKKKQKNRAEIDKKVFKNNKKRRRVDSEDSEESDKSEESDSKSETDDSSIDIGKIKKAAKRKLSKRRYSHSSSESESSESSEPKKQTRRTAAKKGSFKANVKSDSESTEVSGESEEDTRRSKKKNVIRDDSTDTDDYYDKKSDENDEGEDETTEDEEKEPVKPKRAKKDVDKTEESEKENPEEASSNIVDDKDMEQTTDSQDENESKKEETENKEANEENVVSQNDTVLDNNLPENVPVGPGIIRPSPQYSMGQGPQQNQQHFPGRSPPYGSPPHRPFMPSPSHGSYPPQQGPMAPPNSQPYPSQMGPNFSSSESGPTPSQGPMSSSQYHQMQQRPPFSSSGPFPQGQGQIYGRPPQGHPMMQNQQSSQDSGPVQQGPRPDMMGQMRGPYPMQEGSMMRGPMPGQQMMRGPYNPQQQQLMMMQGQFPRFPHEQMRGQHPGQYSGPMRGPYPNTSQQEYVNMTNAQNSSKEGKTQNQEQTENRLKSPEHQMRQGFQANPMLRGQFPGPHRPVARGPFPERPMMQNQGPYRPYSGEMRPGYQQGPPEYQNRMSHPGTQSSPMDMSSNVPSMSSPPIDSNRQFFPGNQPRPHMSQIPFNNSSQITGSTTETTFITSSTANQPKKDTPDSSNSSDFPKTLNDEENGDKVETNTEVRQENSTETEDNVKKEVTDVEQKVKTEEVPNNINPIEIENEKRDENPQKDGDKSSSETNKDVPAIETNTQPIHPSFNIGAGGSQSGPQGLRSPPPSQAQSLPNMGHGPPSQGSMIPGPHPYQQGMFRGQFNEMMSQAGHRMPYQGGPGGMPQGPPNYPGSRPGHFMPRMGPDGMGPMHPQFQRPMYGSVPMSYQQQPGVPTSFGPRPEMGMRMPQTFSQNEGNQDGQSKNSGPDSQSEPTKAKKPRKPRMSKKEKEKQAAMAAAEASKNPVSTSPNMPGPGFQQPPQMGPVPHQPYTQMPMSRPMHPQGPYMRPPFDNYGMNGMNPQGPPEYNQMHPYGAPQMMPPNGGRGFMIDNLLEKQPRANNQLEPIISQEEEEEQPVEQEPSQSSYADEEESPPNGEKDMDEMSDIGDIVKYVMNH